MLPQKSKIVYPPKYGIFARASGLYKSLIMNKKRLSDLSAADLHENLIWEYRMENNTEYVMASGKTEVTEGSNTTHLVVTDFIFNNKSKYIGYCSPQDAVDLEQVQPVIIAAKGQLEFYKENEWTENEKSKVLQKLGLHFNEVFPISYQARVKYNRKLLSGTLSNFNEGTIDI